MIIIAVLVIVPFFNGSIKSKENHEKMQSWVGYVKSLTKNGQADIVVKSANFKKGKEWHVVFYKPDTEVSFSCIFLNNEKGQLMHPVIRSIKYQNQKTFKVGYNYQRELDKKQLDNKEALPDDKWRLCQTEAIRSDVFEFLLIIPFSEERDTSLRSLILSTFDFWASFAV